MRNQEQQHLYLHEDLQPLVELAPTENKRELNKTLKRILKVRKHYTASNDTRALGGIVSGTDESSIFK